MPDFLGKLQIPSNVNLVNTASNIASSLIGESNEYQGPNGNITAGIDIGTNKVADTLMKIPGLQAYGAALKGVGVLGKGINKLGGGTDGMTKADAILGSSLFSWNVGAINGFLGKKSETIEKDQETFSTIGSSYSGESMRMDDALSKSNKKYGLLSSKARNKANNFIRQAGRNQNYMQDIAQNTNMNNEMLANQTNIAGFAAGQEQSGGMDINSIRAAKQGTKIDLAKMSSIKNINRAIRLAKTGIQIEREFVINWDKFDSIPEFKNGGQMNVIPEGALHAHKHNIDLDNITKKGIPVVVEEEGGELNQQAEIERNEIIFSKSVTEALEKLYKEYYDSDTSNSRKNELAIEAGKLLSDEIINNTDDRTNLIETV